MVHPVKLSSAAAIAVVFAFGLAGQRAAAGDAPHARLAAATQMSTARERVAVRFEIDPGWHIYWKNPGETGLPTAIAWTLPNAVRAGEIQWPVPERFASATLVNYGYVRSTTLIVPLDGSTKALRGHAEADISWLACAQMCVPEEAKLSVPLGANSGDASLFTASGAALPQPLAAAASVRASRDRLTLILESPLLNDVSSGAVAFLPATRWAVDDRVLPRVEVSGDRLTFDFRRYRHPRPLHEFAGVLVVAGKGDVGLTLDQVIEMTTLNPAKAIGEEENRGTLKAGVPADITVMELLRGDYLFSDGKGCESLRGTFLLEPRMLFKSGEMRPAYSRYHIPPLFTK